MTTAVIQGTLSASEHSTQLRKAIIASTIGTAIEWYDFSFMAPLQGSFLVSSSFLIQIH